MRICTVFMHTRLTTDRWFWQTMTIHKAHMKDRSQNNSMVSLFYEFHMCVIPFCFVRSPPSGLLEKKRRYRYPDNSPSVSIVNLLHYDFYGDAISTTYIYFMFLPWSCELRYAWIEWFDFMLLNKKTVSCQIYYLSSLIWLNRPQILRPFQKSYSYLVGLVFSCNW